METNLESNWEKKQRRKKETKEVRLEGRQNRVSGDSECFEEKYAGKKETMSVRILFIRGSYTEKKKENLIIMNWTRIRSYMYQAI
jgi:hypothetical protein